MRILGPTPFRRLNEAAAIVWMAAATALILSLISYHPDDPSWNTAAGPRMPENWIGPAGAIVADLLWQGFGLGAVVFPLALAALGLKWLRSRPIEAPWAKIVGFLLLVSASCGGLALGPDWRLFGDAVAPGGLWGLIVSDFLVARLNTVGTALVLGTCWLLSWYLVSTFSLATLAPRLPRIRVRRRPSRPRPAEEARAPAAGGDGDRRPAESGAGDRTPDEETDREGEEIPIRTLEDMPEASPPTPVQPAAPSAPPAVAQRTEYRLPPTSLLNEPPERNGYDRDELQEIAAAIKSKFEEFNVFGSVVQINPGPVVTTFEFKPEPGIKYSRIVTLTEDLCLGLKAESILIERIPGKATVGIEVPNNKRELISLRQVLESEEFRTLNSPLPVPLGKDVSGRIKAVALDSMPHLLIAGSTGSGKSVMLNSVIMSILFKSTPEEVRMIMIDPKRVELGVYEGVPHLLTPVITDPERATNALRNAVLEMERRYKLLASESVRNIEQFNQVVRQRLERPQRLFEAEPAGALEPLPYIVIVIDELADLMMMERANVEGAIKRLAHKARATGMHLVVATQRPSVDVITGIIKANFPARISFRVATRVDSRTILDVMGAEHLLGRGDMLFLPPGSARLIRLHGALVTESEIQRVVEFWKQQAQPDYDVSFLASPPSEDEKSDGEDEAGDENEDPLYEEAVRIVVELGKASTSTLQRRLRLGYGRAARLLDRMQREGIIGPPEGSRPRDILRVPEWLRQTEPQAR